MKVYYKQTMAHLRHWFSAYTKVWVENATSFTPDYDISHDLAKIW